ncbi:MAG: LacI family DNA-binding transcriptional regulator [Actinomycetota bacterium]|nr:LacI family DNA-binding transcriptional regulator [Actinomycetota bacterium]
MSVRAVTLADVALRAGVSQATASRVLNGSERVVGVEYQQRVMEAASELNYRPNVHAQAVARGASSTVGLLVTDIADPYFSSIASGVMEVAEQRGLVVLLANTRRGPALEISYVEMLAAQRARALVVIGSRTNDRDLTERMAKAVEAFRSNGGRVACVSEDRLGTHTVLPRNRAGARDLAIALAALGHRRFAVLAGPAELLTARDRRIGFRAGLSAAGVDPGGVEVVHGALTRDGGYEAAARLLERDERPTCVFAVNDVMAVGAMAALRDHGVAVPGDISVAGFDDIETLRDIQPTLTTVRLPLVGMGVTAAEMVLDDGPPTPRVVRVRGDVVLRASTASPRAAEA